VNAKNSLDEVHKAYLIFRSALLALKSGNLDSGRKILSDPAYLNFLTKQQLFKANPEDFRINLETGEYYFFLLLQGASLR